MSTVLTEGLSIPPIPVAEMLVCTIYSLPNTYLMVSVLPAAASAVKVTVVSVTSEGVKNRSAVLTYPSLVANV